MLNVVYTAEGLLCATLYARNGGDGPLAGEAVINGRPVPLGEDLSGADDGCTHRGNAKFPAYSPRDGVLAAVVAAVGDPPGPQRIDQEWAVVTVTNGQSATVLSPIRHPRGLAWLSSEQIVVAAEIAGETGLWLMDADGNGLTLVAQGELGAISADPSSRHVLGVVISDPSVPTRAQANQVVVIDLGGAD
jgi:hypothetical protein